MTLFRQRDASGANENRSFLKLLVDYSLFFLGTLHAIVEIAFLNPLGLSLIQLTLIEYYEKQVRDATVEKEEMAKRLVEAALAANDLFNQIEALSLNYIINRQKTEEPDKRLAEAKTLLQYASVTLADVAVRPDNASATTAAATAATALARVDLNVDNWTRIKASLHQKQKEEAAAKKADRNTKTAGLVHHQQQRTKTRRSGFRRGF